MRSISKGIDRMCLIEVGQVEALVCLFENIFLFKKKKIIKVNKSCKHETINKIDIQNNLNYKINKTSIIAKHVTKTKPTTSN